MHPDRCKTNFRLLLPTAIVSFFLLFILTTSIIDVTRRRHPLRHPMFPDFSQYKYLSTLPESHFPIRTSLHSIIGYVIDQRACLDSDDQRRIIAIGDIHAMNQSLSALLTKVSYDPHFDTLVHLGDLVTKGKHPSGPVLDFMATNNILGVRGNNDQKVIEWKAWVDWILSLPGGGDWLEEIDSQWSHVDEDEFTDVFQAWLKHSYRGWDTYIPTGWKLLGKHYRIARDMSREHYDYLRSLPLILHAPTAHTYFVHAGLLPADPTLEVTDPDQPLSHWPTPANPNDDAGILRDLQELALLKDVPQNQDPWVVMNMRSLTDEGVVKDSKKGIPWSDLWNDVMGRCSGFDATSETWWRVAPSKVLPRKAKNRVPLPCFPSMVVYGHAAVRDLDVKRWSIGVDTGCTYGRRLTAVILDRKSLPPSLPNNSGLFDNSFLQDSFIPFGDEGKAQIVSVDC